ncbi:unnamed protein product [Blepharisma stoltei]|uniref:Uncharacterized protein n=1 Tax=Blepharisma stoltei TaxID=1481888 RepID=A0AAU9KDK1_9CILI|nr:unnamed protein product [Blepharisma stoltei]
MHNGGEGRLNIGDLDFSGGSPKEELEFEESSVESNNLRMDIEKLRAATEDAIRNIRENYLFRESELISQIQSEDMKKALLENRPGTLETNDDLSIEELKQFEIARMEEIESLKRIGHKASSKESMFNLSSSEVSSIFRRSLENQGEDVGPIDLEKCSEAIKEKYQKEVEDMERAVRDECEVEFDKQRKQLRFDYENKMNQEISEVQNRLNEYWQERAEELEDKINQLSEARPRSTSELEKIYQSQYEERLAVETQRLKAEIEVSLRNEYEIMLNQRVEAAKKETQDPNDFLTDLRREMEEKFQQRLVIEKNEWKEEIQSIILPEIRSKLEPSLKEKLAEVESKVKQDADVEIKGKVEIIKKEAEERIKNYIQKVAQRDYESLKEKIKEDMKKALRKEQESKLQTALDAEVKLQIEREIRKELTLQMESQVYEEVESRVKEEIRNELIDLYKNRQKQIRHELNAKLKAAQEKYTIQQKKEVAKQVAGMLEKREKEIKNNLRKKLERDKKEIEAELAKEYEGNQSYQRVKTTKELTEISKTKAQLIVQIKKVKQEKKEELNMIRKQREELEQKIKDLEQIQEKNFFQNKTPMSQRSTIFQPEIVNEVQAQDIETPNENAIPHENIDPPRMQSQRKLLSHYNSQDLLNQIISKNMQETQDAYRLLEETKDPPSYYRRSLNESPADTPPIYYRS